MTKRAKFIPRREPSASLVSAGAGGWGTFAMAWPVGLIAAACAWIYGPALHATWYIDDSFYITENPLLSDPSRLWKAWFQPGSFIEYYPLEQTVQWVQWRLWHDHTFGYHLTNLVLHFVNALLVWRLLAKFRLRLAWVGGLIFAIHPLQVESVAWISELKNTLSLTPMLLAMCAYVDFGERRFKSDYLLALGLFLVAMLCKISVAGFPVIILLYVWWKRDRVTWGDLTSSAPFFLISLVLGATTIWCGQHFAGLRHLPNENIPIRGLAQHLTLVGTSGIFYLAHAILPLMPLPDYPFWSIDSVSLVSVYPWVTMAFVSVVLWNKRQTWGRHAILGIGFFFISIMPFLGFISCSYMATTWVMDHFVYFPVIGLIGLAVAMIDDLGSKMPVAFRSTGAFAVGAALGLLAWESHAYATIFADPLKLWPYTLAHNPTSSQAHFNLGVSLPDTAENRPRIMAEYEATVRSRPDFWPAYNNLGTGLLAEKRYAEAKGEFEQTLRLWRDYDIGHFNLGLAWIKLNHPAEAMAEFKEAVRCNPGLPDFHYDLGHLYLQAHRGEDALHEFQQADALRPGDPDFEMDLAGALVAGSRAPEAIPLYEQVLKAVPTNAEAHDHLADALLQVNDVAGARQQIGEALRLKPNYAQAHSNLGTVLYQSGDFDGCIRELRLALADDPGLNTARVNLGAVLYQTGHQAESEELLKEAFLRGSDDSSEQDNRIRSTGKTDH